MHPKNAPKDTHHQERASGRKMWIQFPESVAGAQLARHDQARRIRSVGGIALACKPAPKGVRVHGLWAVAWEMETYMYLTASPDRALRRCKYMLYGLSGGQCCVTH